MRKGVLPACGPAGVPAACAGREKHGDDSTETCRAAVGGHPPGAAGGEYPFAHFPSRADALKGHFLKEILAFWGEFADHERISESRKR